MSINNRPQWAKYRAWDKDGLGCWFAERPQICLETKEWVSAGKQQYSPKAAPKCNWRKSLEVLDD